MNIEILKKLKLAFVFCLSLILVSFQANAQMDDDSSSIETTSESPVETPNEESTWEGSTGTEMIDYSNIGDDTSSDSTDIGE
jgi:hypothetical protein